MTPFLLSALAIGAFAGFISFLVFRTKPMTVSQAQKDRKAWVEAQESYWPWKWPII